MKTIYLLVPGYTNAGPEHWQSYIENKYSNTLRIEQDDWNSPSELWVEKINNTINSLDSDLILLGHSCGAVAVAQWASKYQVDKVRALILVAPADVESENAIKPIITQRPLPTDKILYKSLVIFSENDQHLSEKRARHLAKIWGSATHLIPGAGHIHTAAGYGEWEEGEKIIEEFTNIRFHRK